MLNAFALSLAVLTPPADDPVVFTVNAATGSTTHEWICAHRLFVDRFERRVNGEKTDLALRFEVHSERMLSVQDDVIHEGPDRPAQFRRQYNKAHIAASMSSLTDPEAPKSQLTLTSPHQGTSVVWTWVPSEREYGRYYDAAEGDVESLPHLEPELFSRAFLPAGAVSVGDKWSVESSAVLGLFQPGGSLSVDSEKGSRLVKRNLKVGIGGGYEHVFSGDSKGSVELELVAVADGVAQVKITLDRLRFLKDVTRVVTDLELGREANAGLDTKAARIILDLSAEGTLLWDLNAGRLKAIDLTGDEAVGMTLDSLMPGDIKVVEQIDFRGGFRVLYKAK